MDSPCLFKIMVAILLYADNVVLLSKFGVRLQKLWNKLYDILLAFKSMYLRRKSWYLAAAKGNYTKRHFSQTKTKLRSPMNTNTLGLIYYSHGYFEPSRKRWRIASMKALMGTLRKEAVVGVTCWELKSHLFKALVPPTFTYGIEIWGGNLKNSHWRFLRRVWRCIWCLTSKCVLRLLNIFFWPNLKNYS